MLLACLKKDEWHSEGDHFLWAELRDGSQKALEELFKRHHQHLFNYGLNIVSDRELLNDAIQHVFLTIWKQHKQLSEAQSVKAYLLTSLRRSIFEKVERNANRKERGKTYLEKKSEYTFSIEHEIVQKEISHELSEKLSLALEELTSRQKEAIYLRFYNGLTNDEIASIMDISYQGGCNLLCNAIARLRSAMNYSELST